MTGGTTAKPSGLSFRQLLENGGFPIGVEIVSTRGFPANPGDAPPIILARELLSHPRVGWLSITDNPGGNPMLPADWIAQFLSHDRDRVVIHMTCKDANRAGLESLAWRLAAEGLHNILALTGDYPAVGFGGKPQGVFDLDSVGLIALLKAMNDGRIVTPRPGKTELLSPTRFYIGCAVSPFKRYERELVPQYFKLVRKIATGAEWVITQLGYDMRKYHEVKLFLQARGISGVPVIGNVYLLTKTVARLFHDRQLPGCVVTDELWELCQKYAAGPDRGKKFFAELAAKQLAVLRGLGFSAGYLGGIHKLESFEEVLRHLDSFAPEDWRQFLKEIQFSFPDEFFFFEHDPETGLSAPDKINRQYLESLRKPRRSPYVTLGYRVSRLVHQIAFTRGKGLWNLAQKLYQRWAGKPQPPTPARLLYGLEKFSKYIMYGCQDCGDCSLPDCAYVCPKRWCSKCSRNGPCGGSVDGQCELRDKECLWAIVYERLKAYGESEEMLTGPPVLYNAELAHTSSWANTYLNRDHHGTAEKRDLGQDTPGGATANHG